MAMELPTNYMVAIFVVLILIVIAIAMVGDVNNLAAGVLAQIDTLLNGFGAS